MQVGNIGESQEIYIIKCKWVKPQEPCITEPCITEINRYRNYGGLESYLIICVKC